MYLMFYVMLYCIYIPYVLTFYRIYLFRQRAVNLVLGMLMGKGEEAGGRDKVGRERGEEEGRED